VKSGIADLKNYPSGRVGSVQGGGAIMAALFLREFITHPDKLQWAHIDAAGTMPSFMYDAPGVVVPCSLMAGLID
jgi:leucyl aminopeptidase